MCLRQCSRMSRKECLILILVFGSVSCSDSGTCTTIQTKPKYFIKHLNGHSFSETESPNHLECAKFCMSFSICKSFDYFRLDKSCKLNDADSTSVQGHEFTHLSGAIFSDISDWPNIMVGSCGKRPCARYKRCVFHSRDPDGKYDCIDYDQFYRDCKEVFRTNPDAKSGPYTIAMGESKKELSVYCDMVTDGGGWTIFQRRFNNATYFYRIYEEYVNGFGDISEEFWLGLKSIQELANQGVTELRLDMTLFNGTAVNEIFEDFKLVDPNYTLQLGSYAAKSQYKANTSTRHQQQYGSASSSWKVYVFLISEYKGMLYNNGAGFSTYDHDVDKNSSHNCATNRKGSWWYEDCTFVDLNAIYSTTWPCMLHWVFSRAECLKSSRMMLRRKT